VGHTHGDGSPEHSHGGSAPGLGWHLLDVLMLVCAVIVLGLWAEVLWKAWRAQRAEGIRYSLTPEGQAATTRKTGEGGPPLVDLGALAADVAARDQAAAAARDQAAANPPPTLTGTDYLRRKARNDR